MLQISVHGGLILRKVLINDKHYYKTITKNTNHTILSLCNYFPFRIDSNKRVGVFMQLWNTEACPWKKYCEGVTDQWTLNHVLHDLINTTYVTQTVNHIPMVRNTITKILQWVSSKNVCSVYIMVKMFAECIIIVNAICDF